MADKYLIVGLVFAACILLVVYTQTGGSEKADKSLSLKEKLQKEFPSFKVIERNQNIIICKELDNRRIPEELVLIRFDPEQQKNLRITGQTLYVTYPKQPTLREIKKDIAAQLKL